MARQPSPTLEPRLRRLNLNVPQSSFEMLDWLSETDYRTYTDTMLLAIRELYDRRRKEQAAA